jgi:hemerythrin-like domain-containing protein
MSVVERVKSYIGAYSATDIRSLLHADHEQFSALTEQMAGDDSKGKRVRAFDQLKPFLTAHARAEEQAVYIPLVNLRGSPDSRADGNEGFVEHSLVDVLMERLSKTELAATDAWRAHAQVLQEMLEHHIKEEERGIFEELGEHFTDEQRDAMGVDFVARKQKLLPIDGTRLKKAA